MDKNKFEEAKVIRKTIDDLKSVIQKEKGVIQMPIGCDTSSLASSIITIAYRRSHTSLMTKLTNQVNHLEKQFKKL
jgi:hypothetical protein